MKQRAARPAGGDGGLSLRDHRHARQDLPLRWELTDEATNRLVAQDQALTIIPSTNDEGRDWYVWVPAPRSGRRYYITVTIYQPEKQLLPLRHFDTQAFSVEAT